MILILGGTAAYFLNLEDELCPQERYDLTTPYGPAFPIFLVQTDSPPWPPGTRLAFASRHGLHRLDISPPFVNARANIWAAHHLGVRAILGWNGVGAINPLLELHDMLVLDQVIDGTRMRPRSFGTDKRAGQEQQAPTSPFCNALRDALFRTAEAHTARAFSCGVYACSEGPRLETAAEIQLFRRQGADVVGMTLVPEVFLAHELGIGYGSLAYVTNYATGVEPAHDAPRHFGVAVAQQCLTIVRAAALLFAHNQTDGCTLPG